MAEIRLEDHSEEVLAAMAQQALKALTECGLIAEGFAQGLCPVDTGALRNSITHKVIGDECFIGTNVEYAPYIEFGTGKYYPGGRKSPWTYVDKDGIWHMTDGQRAKPFLRPAVADHLDLYKQIINDELKG